jgi:hypothetical protein
LADALTRWQQLVSIVRASGRRAVFLVVPEKSTVYPEHLPPAFPNKQCSQQGKRALWGMLDQASRTGVVGLNRLLLADKRRHNELLYKRKDTHWNSLGALVLAHEVLARIGRGIRIDPDDVTNPGPERYTGDLTAFIGAPQSDTTPQRAIRRSANAPRVPGRTLYIEDSFGDAPLSLLMPYFASLTPLQWFNNSPQALATAIVRANTIIFETAEREFTYRATVFTEPTFLRQLRTQLVSLSHP